MQYIVAVILLSLLQYWVFTIMVSRYRRQVLAPAMSGPPEFERALRVQLNTAERLVSFIPLVWLFGVLVSPYWGTVLGAIFLVGRILYAVGYLHEPSKRFLGSLVCSLVELTLLGGSLYGLATNWSILS